MNGPSGASAKYAPPKLPNEPMKPRNQALIQAPRSRNRTPSAMLLKRMPEANPFQDPLRFERRVPPCAIVIFGANGDLTKRKLIPALYRLAYERRLPPGFAIIGNSRTGMSDEAFREKMKEALHEFVEDTPFDDRLW